MYYILNPPPPIGTASSEALHKSILDKLSMKLNPA